MSVRCKFKVDSITRSLGSVKRRAENGDWFKDENGRDVYDSSEVQTINMTPVYQGPDAHHENSKFWSSSPSGSFQVGTVNAAAAAQFEIGKEYYIDITPAA